METNPMRVARWIPLATLLTVLAAPASAVSMFALDLTPSSGTATDGTITFANTGDPEPTAFSLAVNGNIYDNIILGAWNVSWIGAQPDVIVGTVQLGIPSEIFPDVFVTSGAYTSTSASGTMTITQIPESGTGVLFGLGILIATRRRSARS
jgi:hypothetical protein